MAKKPQVRPATTDETARIIDALTTAHQSFDAIVSRAGVDPAVARVELLRLFRAGHVIKFLTSYRLQEARTA